MDPLPLRTSSQHTGGELTVAITSSHTFLIFGINYPDDVKPRSVQPKRRKVGRGNSLSDGSEKHAELVYLGSCTIFLEDNSMHLDTKTCYKLEQNGNFGCCG
jgi:hypothetical protein